MPSVMMITGFTEDAHADAVGEAHHAGPGRRPPRTPAEGTALSVGAILARRTPAMLIIPATERSIPPVMMTRVWPMGDEYRGGRLLDDGARCWPRSRSSDE